MRKTIFAAIIAILCVTVSVNAQEQEDNSGFSKWQARFRIISVIPSVDDNLTGADVDISTSYVPELDFTYFFTENWAAELILGTSKHDVEVEGATDLGHVWLLPPTLNLQYHFTGGALKPYVGTGINYTIFYGVKNGAVQDMDYDNSFGFSFQAGIDYSLNDKWFLNLDAKKILLKTDATVNVDGTTILPVEVDINPLVIGLGIGMKF